eukprot:COSAG06_NODE_43144_length_374_cov_6.090909_1_plen_96_part_01
MPWTRRVCLTPGVPGGSTTGQQIQLEESKGESRQMHQIHLRELVDKGELEDVVYADVDKEYFDEAGLPIAPKNIESIMSRKHTRKMWIDAVNKETG